MTNVLKIEQPKFSGTSVKFVYINLHTNVYIHIHIYIYINLY